MYKTIENLKLGKEFTFLPNKKIPIYNWFYYKEGFSRGLVYEILTNSNLKKSSTVLDPFCGSGTTLLASKELGFNAIGFDVMPISILTSKVKTENYDIKKLQNYKVELFSHKFQKPNRIPKNLKKWFSRYTLEDILFFRPIIDEIEDRKIRDFFKLALITSSIKCSYIFKDGSVLKIRKKPTPPLKLMFKRTVKKMINDLKKFPKTKSKIIVNFGDARNLNVDDESVDIVITSPPYLNKIEYKNIYRIENELFFREVSKPPIRSFFGLRREENFEIKKIIGNYDVNALAYFNDINMSLKEIYRVLKKDSKAHIVVGDALIGEKIIDVLNITAKLSERIGFEVEKIIIGNKRIATTPQRIKIGTLREGMIIIKK